MSSMLSKRKDVKMRRLNKACACVVLSAMGLLVAGCGGNGADDTADDYVECLQRADFDGMRQMSSGDMIQWIDRAERKYAEVSRLLGEKKADKFKAAYDDLKYEVGDVNGEGDRVTASVKVNGQYTPMKLIKLGGKWRIEKFDFPIL